MNSINENREGRHRPGGRFGRHGSKKKKALKLILLPIFLAAFVALKSAAVMLIWNYLIPDLFHGPEVTYLQAVAITVLAKLLTGFGGWGRGGGFGRGMGGRHFGERGGGRGWWDDMSKEEKEKMRDEMRERFARRGGHSEGRRHEHGHDQSNEAKEGDES